MPVETDLKSKRWLPYSYEVYARFIYFTAFSQSTAGDKKNYYISP
jgi:hypothetical protein